MIFGRRFQLAALVGMLTGVSDPMRSAEHPHTYTVIVVVEGMPRSGGQLRVALFARAAGFPNDHAESLVRQQQGIAGTVDSVIFRGVEAAEYAVAVHIDQNGNERLDANALGIPREPWGVSNNVRPRFRVPRFAEAAIRLTTDQRVVIRIDH
jgi:uncharacterized protein (DUF2141 family)